MVHLLVSGDRLQYSHKVELIAVNMVSSGHLYSGLYLLVIYRCLMSFSNDKLYHFSSLPMKRMWPCVLTLP